MFKLVIQDDEGKTTVVPLIRDEITIGRKEGNTIRLTERNVSRRHARILRNNGEVQIEDLGSYNGIRVNNARIAERVNLRVSDQVQIGDYKLYLKAEGVEQVDDARTMPIERIDTSNGGAPTDVHAAVAAPAPTAPIPIPPTPAVGTPVVAAPATTPTPQIIGNPNRTLVAMADTDPTTGRPLARPELIAAAIPQQTGYGKLVVLSSNFAGKEFDLSRPQMIIGRTDENDIVVNHRSISRNHAKVVREPDSGRYTISDLQSSNGVRVNGNDYSKVELRRGDVVDLGHVRLRFVEPGEDFVFSRDAVITDVPESGSKKGLLVAIILGVLVLGGVLVFFLTRAPEGGGKDPGPGTGTGGNIVKADAGDGSQVASGTPPDAAEAIVTPDSGGGTATAASDEIKKLQNTCAEAANDKKWSELEACGHRMEKLDGGAEAGGDFVKRAADESKAEVKARDITTALKAGDLKKAGELLGGIKNDSVYRKAAQQAYDEKKKDVVDTTVADLKQFIREKNCTRYNNKLKTIRQSTSPDIAAEAAKVAGKCEAEVAIVTPPPPKTCDPACGEGMKCEGTRCVKKDPGGTTPPPPNPCADVAMIADTEKKGDDAMSGGSYAAALSQFETVFRCKPAVASKAYLAACKAHNFPKAKTYFKMIGKESLAQICLKEGFDPRN